jgi:hypothetical protein
MAKKKAIQQEIIPAIEKADVLDAALNIQTLKNIADASILDHELDGIVIVAVKKGVFVPFVQARNVTELITLDFIAKREIAKILDNVMTSQQK